MDAILAIDTGGTKCDALLARFDGRVLGSGHCAIPGVGGRSERAIVEAVWEALTVREFDRLIIASLGSFFPMSIFRTIRARHIEVNPGTEEDGAFTLAGVANGVVALSGTGSMIYARNEEGRHVKYDGMGPFLGDDGSGYRIGMLALRAVVRSLNHPRHATSLRPLICEMYEVRLPNGLLKVNWATADRSEVARLARLVDEEARKGDGISLGILRDCADAMWENIRDAIDTLGMNAEPYTMVGTGSIVARSDIFWDRLCERLRADVPAFRAHRNDAVRPVVGILLYALRNMPDIDLPSVQQRVLATADFPAGAPAPVGDTAVKQRPASASSSPSASPSSPTSAPFPSPSASPSSTSPSPKASAIPPSTTTPSHTSRP